MNYLSNYQGEMSNAVMAEPSSSYTDSIKFYERMSHLQGELKNYESQQFQLEEEFQRLWTQGTSLPSSSSQHQLIMSTQPQSSTSVHFASASIPLTNKSQSSANPNNLNYHGRNEDAEIRRRARNQEILEKLQQLETNASIYAARSERLKMMKAEYESLVRKYSSNRKWISASSATAAPGQSFLAQSREKTFLSTGMNTDISGPIKSISASSDRLRSDILQLERSQDIDASDRLKGSGKVLIPPPPLATPQVKDGESNDSLRDLEEKAFFMGRNRVRPTFLDISSTSESDLLQGPSLHKKREQQQQQPFGSQQDMLDDTSIDTTSISVLAPKSRSSNYMLNVSTDGSLSESASMQIPTKPTKGVLKYNSEKNETPSGDHYHNDNADGHPSEESPNGTKGIINSRRKSRLNEDDDDDDDREEDPCSSVCSKTEESIGDSVMDSVQNKTPDSLPRDDSELLHITEVDEENDDVDVNDEEDHKNDKDMEDSESQEARVSVSLPSGDPTVQENEAEKLREAREEIETWRFKKDSDGRHLEEGLSGKPKFSWLNKFAAIGGSVSELELGNGKGASVISTSGTNGKSDRIAGKDEITLSPRESSKEDKGQNDGAGSGGNVMMGQLVDRKPEEKSGVDPKMTLKKDFSSEQTKSLLNDETDRKTEGNPSRDSSDGKSSGFSSTKQNSKTIAVSGRSGSTGNDSKKVRLKLDYDDSESDRSNPIETFPGMLSKESQNKTQFLGNNPKKDEDFDDFFD